MTEYILEVAVERDLNQTDLADLMVGVKVITPETALQLERVFAVPAAIWVGLEAGYRKI